MGEKFQLSVVMATYNRAEILPETIRYLENQDLDAESFEVIVVDDGSSDNTRAVVLDAIPRVGFQLRYLHHENRGPGYSQNRGICEARAPIIVLMPDDILMTAGGLRAHLAAHVAHPEQEVAVLGNIRQSPAMKESVFLRIWDPYRFEFLPAQEEFPYYMFWAINISIKRDFLRKYGMFREQRGRAGPAAHEDVELGYRLSKHGLRIIHSKEALGYHHHVETLEGALRRSYERGLNLGEFRKLVPEPEIAVRYHVLNWRTLVDHFRALLGPRRKLLMGADRSVTLLTARYILRFVLFNQIAVSWFWIPLMKRAEQNVLFEKLMHRELYRGVIAHYSQKGQRDARGIYGF